LTDVGPATDANRFDQTLTQRQYRLFNDVQRGYRQAAAFTSIDFDIIPKVLTITAGTRYYISNNTTRRVRSRVASVL